MFEIRQTADFEAWFGELRDAAAKRRIAARLVRVAAGLMGDVKPVGRGVSELRIDHGPGYRIYFATRNRTLILLLCGGDKRTQARDIDKAMSLAAQIREKEP